MLKLTIEVQGLEPLIESINELNSSISSLSPKGTSININVNKDKDKQKEIKEEEDTKETLEPTSEHTEKDEDLSTLTVVKLRTIAEDNGIDSTGLKKKELIEAIEKLTTEIEEDIKEAKETKETDKDPGEEKKNEDPKEEKTLGNLTIEDIREVFVSKNSKDNRAKLKEILGKFGVKKVTDLEPKDFQEVLAELEAI